MMKPTPQQNIASLRRRYSSASTRKRERLHERMKWVMVAQLRRENREEKRNKA